MRDSRKTPPATISAPTTMIGRVPMRAISCEARRRRSPTPSVSRQVRRAGLDLASSRGRSACRGSGRRTSRRSRRSRSAGWRRPRPGPLIRKIDSGSSGLRWRCSLTTNAASRATRAGELADRPGRAPADVGRLAPARRRAAACPPVASTAPSRSKSRDAAPRGARASSEPEIATSTSDADGRVDEHHPAPARALGQQRRRAARPTAEASPAIAAPDARAPCAGPDPR